MGSKGQKHFLEVTKRYLVARFEIVVKVLGVVLGEAQGQFLFGLATVGRSFAPHRAAIWGSSRSGSTRDDEAPVM